MKYFFCIAIVIQISFVNSDWYGYQYWNSRYGDKGISYDSQYTGFFNHKPGKADGYKRDEANIKQTKKCNYLETKDVLLKCGSSDLDKSKAIVIAKQVHFTTIDDTSFPVDTVKMDDDFLAGFVRMTSVVTNCDGSQEQGTFEDVDVKFQNYRIYAQFKNCYGRCFQKTKKFRKITCYTNNGFGYTCRSLGKRLLHKTLTSKIRTIVGCSLPSLPDLSSNAKLKELDLYDNSIQIFRGKYTTLPRSIEWINLVKNKLDKLPNRYFDLPKLQYIALAENEMRYIPDNAFGDVSSLEYAGFDKNQISSIARFELQALSRGKKFVHLNVSNNAINYIAPYALKSLKYLKILELQQNSIETVRKNVLYKIPELLHLEMNKNRIKTLTSQFITDCPKLEVLLLHSQKESYKMQTVYFDSLKNLPKLEKLKKELHKTLTLKSRYLGSNQLTRFPHPVFNEDDSPNVVELYVDNNQITNLRDYSNKDFPASAQVYHLLKTKDFNPFEGMKNLRKLDISNNDVQEIKEDDLEYAKELRELHIQGNHLQELMIHEKALENNTKLYYLDLSTQSPPIQYIPRALTANRLTELTVVLLGQNQITYILNGTFANLPNLEYLSLTSNKIIAIEDGAFPESIQELYVGGNRFRFKNQRQFSNLPRLRILDLQSNLIDVIPDDAFVGLIQLDTLRLSYNSIYRLMKTHFRDATKLRVIELQRNQIAFIEDGTFATIRRKPFQRIETIDLQYNQLTRIPLSDFWNVEFNILRLRNNYITEVQTNAFVNVSRSREIDLHYNRLERIMGYGFNNVECGNIKIGGAGSDPTSPTGRDPYNPLLKEIQSHAYYDVKVGQLDLSWLSVKNIPEYAFKLRGLDATLYLNNGKLQSIASFAFDLGRVNGDIDLSKSDIIRIGRKIFAPGTSFRTLKLFGNAIEIIMPDAFDGSSMSGQLEVSDNQLREFPKAFSVYTGLRKILIWNNLIEKLPGGTLDAFPNLDELNMNKNLITVLEQNIFRKNTKLKYLKMENNPFKEIQDGAFDFDSAPEMIECRLHCETRDRRCNNIKLEHIPQFTQLMPKLQYFITSKVQTIAENVFNDKVPRMNQLAFDTTELQCDCQFYDTILKYLDSGKDTCYRLYRYECRTIQCAAPNALAGYKQFRGVDRNIIRSWKNDFICSPMGITVTAPRDYTIQIDFTYPPRKVAEGASITSSDDLFFEATCALDGEVGAKELKASVLNKKRITLSGNEILPGRNYRCSLTMTFTQGGANKTSARTKKVLITTLERKDKVSLCANGDPYECKLLFEYSPCKADSCDVEASNALNPGTCVTATKCCNYCYQSCFKCNNTVKATVRLNITYYDFPVDDADFSARVYKPDDCCPKYIASPYESWLARSTIPDPTTDSFSDWFRSTSTRNLPISEVLTLANEEGDIDPVNGEQVFAFYSDDYWPVNGKGFKAQDQRGCGKDLLNMGFTSAIRSSFTFRGTEHFQFAGGEDLWVYVNKVLVLHIIAQNPLNTSVECKTFQLKNATGNGVIVPSVGTVDSISRSCVNQREVPSEAVNLNLRPDITYGLDIFHVERFKCTSQFMFRASGVYFIPAGDWLSSTPRIDYLSFTPEDAHRKSIVADILLTDQYRTRPPYTVTIISGNEEERFAIVSNTTAAHAEASRVPPPKVHKNVTLHGEAIIICENETTTTGRINKTSSGPQVFSGITTRSGLVILKDYLDYESTSEYLLRIHVIDRDGVEGTGNIAIKILVTDQSDNCPIFKSKPLTLLHPVPPLQADFLLVVDATDLDSGENGRISYVISEIIQKIPTVDYKKFIVNTDTGTKVVWQNTTTLWTVTYNVFAVDNGRPRRGDFFPVQIKYDPSCDVTASLVVNDTGEVYFRAPKMTNYNETKFRYGKSECYECAAGYFCPGDGREEPCVQNETSKHYYSYGFQTKCSPCPEGWLCHDGLIIKCAPNTYVKCNDTWCPKECFPCEEGTYCYDGIQIVCQPGTWSDGKGPCRLCPPGSYSNSTKAPSCSCCPTGYESTKMKTGCEPCQVNEYSTGECTICKSCWPPGSCGCDRNPCFRGTRCHNIGETGKSFKCDACPKGFEGDGVTCVDIDECLQKPCFHSCINLSPGYRCSGCRAGYNGTAPAGVGKEEAATKQICEDINECVLGTHLCDKNAACINTNGSYTCGKCDPGFVGDGYTGCVSGDFCKSGKHNCGGNATCVALGTEKFYCKCKDGFAGDGKECELDDDYDGISNEGAACSSPACKVDNCMKTPNAGQEDNDIDALGDVCDDDDDDDNHPDELDTCRFNASRSLTDTDGDGFGDICDNCPTVSNRDQPDLDKDGKGDVCDDDIDGDGLRNDLDSCKYNKDLSGTDDDRDGVPNVCDNCVKHANPDQADVNQNGYGDICDRPGTDADGDGIPDDYDNCPNAPNADQADTDDDRIGDFCDSDKDDDGVLDERDNCIYLSNPDQQHTVNYDMAANPVGVACVDDYDGDGIKDEHDTCPRSSKLHTTSFQKHILVDLASATSKQPFPRWHMSNNGRDIEQFEKTLRPSMLIGDQRYSEVSYTGVLHVNEDSGIDYLGIVFGYQSNRKFYLVLWRHENLNYLNTTYRAGIKGVQIKLVNSNTGPSDALTEALWHSDDTANQVELLWHDPQMKGWLHNTAYIFKLEFRPSLGRIRLLIQRGEDVLTDSGYIYNTKITGGKLGVYTHGQWNTIWSRLKATCLQRLNKALLFDGQSTCGTLRSPYQFNIINSFTFGVWIKLPATEITFDPLKLVPLICNNDRSLCFYMRDRKLEGKIGETNVQATTQLKRNEWLFVTMVYDAQSRNILLYVNSNEVAKSSVPLLNLERNKTLHLGCDGSNFYNGILDEVIIWNVYLTQVKIREYMKLAGLVWQRHQRIVTAHYTFDHGPGAVIEDQSEYRNNGTVTAASWVESSVDQARFKLKYPDNYRRKRSVHAEL